MGGRVNCVLRLVGQPLIGSRGQVVEDVIKVGERLPAFDPTGPDQLGSDQVFQTEGCKAWYGRPHYGMSGYSLAGAATVLGGRAGGLAVGGSKLVGRIERVIARHFEAIGKDEVRAGEIYGEDAILEYVQSGERIRGKANIVASRQAYPGRPAGFEVHRSAGSADVQVVERTLWLDGDDPHPVVAILDFRDGQVVRERIYIAEPWDAPEYRARGVEPLDSDRGE
jgi:hypothetical protein